MSKEEIETTEIEEQETHEVDEHEVPETKEHETPDVDEDQVDSDTTDQPEETFDITIEGEDPEVDNKGDQEWLKKLREQNRDRGRRLKELEAKLNQSTEKKQQVLRKKPTLEDHDYDAESFEGDLDKWYGEKRQVDAENEKEEIEAKQVHERYYTAKKTLSEKLPDYDEAEEFVKDSLSVMQQNIILHGAETPANIVYALGKNPALAERMAEIKDPVKFAFAVAKMESKVKMTTRKPPPPEEKVRNTSSGILTNQTQKELEKLEKRAELDGNRSAIIAFKKKNGLI